MKNRFSRRDLLKLGGFGILSAAGSVALTNFKPAEKADHKAHFLQTPTPMEHGEGLPGTGDVDHERNGFNPGDILTDFDYGKVSTLPNGQTLREYEIVAVNKNIEVSKVEILKESLNNCIKQQNSNLSQLSDELISHLDKINELSSRVATVESIM